MSAASSNGDDMASDDGRMPETGVHTRSRRQRLDDTSDGAVVAADAGVTSAAHPQPLAQIQTKPQLIKLWCQKHVSVRMPSNPSMQLAEADVVGTQRYLCPVHGPRVSSGTHFLPTGQCAALHDVTHPQYARWQMWLDVYTLPGQGQSFAEANPPIKASDPAFDPTKLARRKRKPTLAITEGVDNDSIAALAAMAVDPSAIALELKPHTDDPSEPSHSVSGQKRRYRQRRRKSGLAVDGLLALAAGIAEGSGSVDTTAEVTAGPGERALHHHCFCPCRQPASRSMSNIKEHIVSTLRVLGGFGSDAEIEAWASARVTPGSPDFKKRYRIANGHFAQPLPGYKKRGTVKDQIPKLRFVDGEFTVAFPTATPPAVPDTPS